MTVRVVHAVTTAEATEAHAAMTEVQEVHVVSVRLKHAVDIYPMYGSDVEAALDAGADIRHGLIGPGVYASHGYERSHIDGVMNTLKVLKGYLKI